MSRIKRIFGLVVFCVALCSLETAHGQQSLMTIEVSQPETTRAADDGFYVAPELQIAREAKLDLVGFDKKGAVVVSGDSDAMAKMASRKDVKSWERREPEDVEKPMQLMIGYKKGEREDVEKALKDAGYYIVDESERARYFVVTGEGGTKDANSQKVVTPKSERGGAIKPEMLNSLFGSVRESGASSVTPNYQLKIPEPKAPAPGRRPHDREGAASAHPAATVPNDELFEDLWGMRNINAPAAWDVVTESGTIVAVIDTGVEIEHKDLKGNVWVNQKELDGEPGVDDDENGFVDDVHGWDFFNDDNSVFDSEGDDHGTHVAGTIGAVQDDFGVVGVSWKVQIMPVKFLGPDGGSLNDAVDAIYYAVDNGAAVLNNSWGGGGYNPVLEDAIRQSKLFVAAAGNDENDNDNLSSYPASYDLDNVIAVASINENESMSWFSNFGAESVDLGAPGGLILSTVPGNTHDVFSGTSMATPHVSGAFALMLACEQWSDASPLDVKNKLLENVRTLDALDGRCVTGGTLDISFLVEDCSDTPGHGPRYANVIVASADFRSGERTIGEDWTDLAEVELELSGPADVVITANSSARSQGESVLLDIGLAPSQSYVPVFRYITCRSSDWTGITITDGVHLPAGKHLIRWGGYSASGSIELDEGALTVVARIIEASESSQPAVASERAVAGEEYQSEPRVRRESAAVDLRERRENARRTLEEQPKRDSQLERRARRTFEEKRKGDERLERRERRTLEDMPKIKD